VIPAFARGNVSADPWAGVIEDAVVFAAETGLKLTENADTVRAPDVAFGRRERVLAVGDVRGYWPGAPDLAAGEVATPWMRRRLCSGSR
jgi:hypothetical protein